MQQYKKFTAIQNLLYGWASCFTNAYLYTYLAHAYLLKTEQKYWLLIIVNVDSGVVPVPAVSDARMRQNITELDSLLDDLHTAQKTGFADSKCNTPTTKATNILVMNIIYQ